MKRTSLSGQAGAGRKRKQPISLNTFLTRLIWFCVLPLVILAVYLAIKHVYTLRDQQDQEARNQIHNVATSIDHQLGAQIAALQMLAASPLLDDPPRLHEFYSEAMNFRTSFGGHVILSDLSMQMVFHTRAPLGSPLPKLPTPRGHAAAPEVLATGRPAVGDMFLGPIAKEPLVATVVPVVRDGRTKSLLVSVIETRQFQQRLDQVALPAGWSLAVVDSKGEVVAHRSPPGREDHVEDDQPGRFVANCGLSLWTVTLSVPHGLHSMPILAASVALAAAILSGTLFSVLGGRLASRRLARSVAALAEGHSPDASRPIVEEIEAVRDLLNETAAARDAAELIRKEAEKGLHRFELLAAHSRDIILLIRCDDGQILEANSAATDTYGYDREELLSMTIRNLRPPDQLGLTADQMKEADTRGISFDTVHRRKDGSTFPVEVSSRGASIEGLRTLVSVVRDITERKQAELTLRNSLQEKVALLKEVHHRVKNNLQIVVSLLGLQANSTGNPAALEILQDTRNRVRSMALLHEVLYRSGNLARISFATYIGDLCRQIAISFGKSAQRVRVETRVEEIGLPLDQAVPCGLIVNELVSNALKHAFPDERSGSVLVELDRIPGQRLLLKIHDNGVGLPPALDPENTSTLGLQLVFDLAGQLEGNLTVEKSGQGGTRFRLVFPYREDTDCGGES
ncbi:MAG: histidine kinase dimerization/phosphoacceptor domain -containing protein [Syntrophobacter sp.]